MTCSQCGSEVKANAVFCISCGAPTHAQSVSSEDSTRISILEQALGGKYRVLSKIGTGGFASVYMGEHTKLHRKVAIKILHGGFSDDEGMVERFRRESQSAARLSHPNIIDIYDVGESGDVYYFVMQYVQGVSLSRKMELENAIDPGEAIYIIRQVADALAYAHENSVIHRDIKPANVMLDQFGKPVLMDFGIARVQFEQNLTKAGALMGTPLYLPPEQPLGSPVDGRSDIYSLGIMFYEMLAGRPPFENENPVALIFKHIHEQAPHLKTVAPNVDDDLCAIVHRMIEKDPNARYQNGRELVDALDALDQARLKQASYQRQVENLAPDPKTMAGIPQATPIEIPPPPPRPAPPPTEYFSTAKRPIPVAAPPPQAVSVREKRPFPWLPVLGVLAVLAIVMGLVIWKVLEEPPPIQTTNPPPPVIPPGPDPQVPVLIPVSIDTQPWAYIEITSATSPTQLEMTPCVLMLAAGKYSVTFRSPNSSFDAFTREIDVSATNNRFRFQFAALNPETLAEQLLQ